ncbi:PREDICTED: chymotrypsin-1-like [Cyphomyrmex costatus]|uniref:chymotrypsin n=1 Tax=Cyphomyrmex costatus TaxID=456900 RepID=A0A151IJB1_9HYME|nr:PREDICTED: chymotrypsin-1-like [Cyphomyrmex costatus]KYN03322.1 Trypsin-7 [Cyphomyrmex costatus]
MMIQLLFLIPLFTILHCASTQLEERIVGGKLACPGEIPYQISLQFGSKYLCGGVIIDKCHVLTAAHCVFGLNISLFSVNVGATDVRKPHSKHQVQSIYIHEKYNPFTSPVSMHDIALIKLQSPLKFSYLVSSVNLPEQNQTVEAGSVAVVSGYGMISPEGNVTTWLYVVDNIITNETYCRETYENEFNVSIDYNTQICANHPTIQKGSCAGDSGGPLTVNGELIGLVSFGVGICTNVKYPDIYTRVPSYIDWINDHMDKRYI